MATAKQAARALFRANRKKDLSWRDIERHGYQADDIIIKPGINATTLCRVAKSKGTWLPKDIEILKLLGLHHEKQPRPKSIWDMSANELLHSLKHRQPYQPTMTQKQLREFVRACKAGARA
jgi:hypothetical protein